MIFSAFLLGFAIVAGGILAAVIGHTLAELAWGATRAVRRLRWFYSQKPSPRCPDVWTALKIEFISGYYGKQQ